MNLDFKRGSKYTRKSIGEICFPGVGRPAGGNWDTGYVRVEDNIDFYEYKINFEMSRVNE